MPGSELHYLTLGELAPRIRSGELSPVELTRLLLGRIEKLDPTLHSYVTVLPGAALSQAARAESEIARGHYRGPLHGIPIALKDLCATKGVRTTWGTRILADWVPEYDAAIVERFAAAGAVVLGKLSLTEGAYGFHHPDVTPPVNPWDASRWSGVSSSGSGVATAAGLCYASIGTDTGGSIRFPSACCGIVGLKPTYGRVPTHGILPLAASLDHVGPMTRSVADAATVLGVIAGHDPRDPASLREPVPDYSSSIGEEIRGMRIGLDQRYCTEDVAPEVSEALFAASEVLRELGAGIREVSVPSIGDLLDGWNLVAGADAALAHRRTFPLRAGDYGPEFRAFLEAGLRATATDYARIQVASLEFSGRLAGLFEDIDLLLCPSMPFPPVPADLLTRQPPDDRAAGSLMQFTAPYDFSGSPTLSVPCGFTGDGLPLSLQLVGRHLEEERLCSVGHAYEQATDWHLRRPQI